MGLPENPNEFREIAEEIVANKDEWINGLITYPYVNRDETFIIDDVFIKNECFHVVSKEKTWFADLKHGYICKVSANFYSFCIPLVETINLHKKY